MTRAVSWLCVSKTCAPSSAWAWRHVVAFDFGVRVNRSEQPRWSLYRGTCQKKRRVDDTDIMPAFHYSFSICRICHRHDENTCALSLSSVGKGKSRPVRPKEAHGGFIISNKSDGHVSCISTVDGGFQKACFQWLTMSFMSVTKDRNAYKRYVFCNDCALGHPAGLENIKSLRPLQPRSERFLFLKMVLQRFLAVVDWDLFGFVAATIRFSSLMTHFSPAHCCAEAVLHFQHYITVAIVGWSYTLA